MNIFSKQQLMTIAPGLNALKAFSELIFTLALSGGGQLCYFHFTEETTEAHRGDGTNPGASQGWKGQQHSGPLEEGWVFWPCCVACGILVP